MSRARTHRRPPDAGFTLVEVMVAAAVLLVGLLGVVTLLDGANRTTSSTRAREGAVNLARAIVERAREVPYAQLTPSQLEARLQAGEGLADASAAPGWQISRRGFTYTIDADVCSYDDAKDGTGPHDVGSFCADSPGSSSSNILDFTTSVNGVGADGSVALGGGTPDDYRRFTLRIDWDRGTGTRNLRQASIIENPGDSGGPSITLFATASATITNLATVNVVANATVSAVPANVTWSVDGTTQGTATGAGVGPYVVTWPILQTPDGTYQLGVQAYAADGTSGAPRELTITLNRQAPAAPTGFRGGKNGSIVEFEWLPNVERDVIGYRVFKDNLVGADTQVCALTQARTCAASGQTFPSTYYVVAYDRDSAGNERAGAASLPSVVTSLNIRPNPPTGLLASKSGSNTILAWQAPNPDDPDLLDSIDFYRIYRDGSAYANRYDRTASGAFLTFTDKNSGGVAHTYYVSAVDDHLAESTLAGPVVR